MIPQRSRSVLKRQKHYKDHVEKYLLEPTDRNGYLTTSLSHILRERCLARGYNPIPGCKTVSASVKHFIKSYKIREFLLTTPFQLLKELMSGKLTEDTVAMYAPNPNGTAFPCVYLSNFLYDERPFTCRELGKLAQILLSPSKTTRVLDRVLPGCSIGGHTASAAVSLAKVWVLCLESFGLDMRSIDDKNVITWDVPSPVNFGYIGYTDNPERRFQDHTEWTKGTTLRSLNHLLPMVGEHVFGDGHVVWNGTSIWSPYNSEFERGKFAELIFAELCSYSMGIYAWEGGLNINVCGDPAAMPKKVSRISQELAYLHYGPMALEGYRRDTEYLRTLYIAGTEKSTGILEQALKAVRKEVSDKRKELTSAQDAMEDLMHEVTKEYKVLCKKLSRDLLAWKKAARQAEAEEMQLAQELQSWKKALKVLEVQSGLTELEE